MQPPPKWRRPPRIKIYEALGAIADGRVRLTKRGALVWSSSRRKRYHVTFDEISLAISSNDNGSYFKGYLGYPAIAVLMRRGVLPFDDRLAELLRGIQWKTMNERRGHNYAAIEQEVRHRLESHPEALAKLDAHLCAVAEALEVLRPSLKRLEAVEPPPVGW